MNSHEYCTIEELLHLMIKYLRDRVLGELAQVLHSYH